MMERCSQREGCVCRGKQGPKPAHCDCCTHTAFSVRLHVLPAAQHTPNRKSLHSRSKGNGSSTRHFLHGNPHKPSRDPRAVPPRVLELPLSPIIRKVCWSTAPANFVWNVILMFLCDCWWWWWCVMMLVRLDYEEDVLMCNRVHGDFDWMSCNVY